MQFDQNTPRGEITIQGQKFTVPAPYTEGHTLTAAEADALNQLVAENMRGRMAFRIRKARETGEALPSQDDLDAFIMEYEFGQRRSTTAPIDPVEKEARAVARTKVKEALRRKGVSLKDVPAEALNKLVEQALEQHGQTFRAYAAKIVKQREAIANAELDIAA